MKKNNKDETRRKALQAKSRKMKLPAIAVKKIQSRMSQG
jgi:hypothetical protein